MDPSLMNIPHPILPAGVFQECGATPESENLTLSSSGAIDQSSCTGTPLSSTISSPEGTAQRGSQVLARQESGIAVSDPSCCGGMQRGFEWSLPTPLLREA